MSQDKVQTLLNRLSLVMTIDADIVKACKESNLSPRMIEVLLRLHDQQKQLEKSINESMQIMSAMATLIDSQANFAVSMHKMVGELSKRVGYDEDEFVTSAEVGQGD